MTEGNNFVTVMVSIELLAQLQHDWSSPVQIQIESTTSGTGYVMNARNHACPPDSEVCTCRTIAPSGWDPVQQAVDPRCPLHAKEPK